MAPVEFATDGTPEKRRRVGSKPKSAPLAAVKKVLEGYLQDPSQPVPEVLQEVYGKGSHAKASADRVAPLLARACKEFSLSFEDHGCNDVHLMRSPARVNLRGMHVDNNGGYTNSICVDREVLMLFSILPRTEDQPLLRLRNLSGEEFGDEHLALKPGLAEEDVARSTGWGKYVAGVIVACEQVAGITDWPFALHGVVTSSCPARVGLSSSHALVICVLGGLFEAAGLTGRVDPVLELRSAQRAEHLAGVRSGLMDQGSMIFGVRNAILHGRFYDLQMEEIPETIQTCSWPAGCSVVVVNSRVTRQLAAAGNAVLYALPRLGCAIALPILRDEAKRRGLAAEDASSWGLKDTLNLLKVVPASAKLDELMKAFPERAEEILAAVQRFIPGGREGLGDMAIPFRASTIFTLAESARAKDFFTSLKAGDLKRCGRLMDVGHEGDAPDGELHISDSDLDELAKRHEEEGLCFIPGAFRAGHARLDEICAVLRAAGAEGASLTGAGRGGCVVGLFSAESRAAQAVEALLQGFPDLRRDLDVFTAVPIEGRSLLDLSKAL